MASANVSGPLRWKRAKIHRGSRQKNIEPHHEAGYTSAVVTLSLSLPNLLQSGGVHIHPHMTASDHSSAREKTLANRGPSTHEAALLVDLAELLFQLGDEDCDALLG